MCGIAGFWGAFPRPLLDAMSASIAHRGPDGAGSFYNAEATVGLAHRRLAIIELGDTGAQPMAETSRGVTLIYNGELYNFRDLRHELEQRGCVGATSCGPAHPNPTTTPIRPAPTVPVKSDHGPAHDLLCAG